MCYFRMMENGEALLGSLRLRQPIWTALVDQLKLGRLYSLVSVRFDLVPMLEYLLVQ
jgi:hypothetical protein